LAIDVKHIRAGAVLVVAALVLPILLLDRSVAIGGFTAGGDDRRKGYPVSGDDYHRGGGGHAAGGASVEYLVDWAAEPCTRTDAERGGCVPGLVNCPGRPHDETNNWQLATVSWRVVGTEDWNELPAECLNRAVIGTPEITPEIARAETFKRLPTTTFTLSPARAGIVNLPEIFSVNQPQNIVFTVPILGQQVTLRTAGERYDWTFGDGVNLSVGTPGAAYAAGSVCSSDDDCADYVHHTYRRSNKTGYPVAVTITWHGQFAVGDGPFQDIPQRITVTSLTVQVPVVETQVIGGR
jgi:hypothetical protein